MEHLYDMIGLIVGGTGIIIVYNLIKTFGKVIDDELPKDSKKHEKKVFATGKKSDEATKKAEEAQEEANERYENDSDDAVVDRAWDAFGTEPRRSRAGNDSTGGSSTD